MTRPLLILLLLVGGCGVSRKEYKRDQDSNLRWIYDNDRAVELRLNQRLAALEKQMEVYSDDLATRVTALEKKIDERKEPCECFEDFPLKDNPEPDGKERSRLMKTYLSTGTDQERPNYPCPYCSPIERSK